MARSSFVVATVFAFAASGAAATDITVVGLFPNKALVQIDGGAPRTLTVGQKTAESVTLVGVDRDAATFEIDGKRTTIGLGQARIGRSEPSAQSATIMADLQGHFPAEAQVNGRPMRFLVDTGATFVSLPSADARHLGIDYTKGQQVLMRTASGGARGYMIKLDTVSVGGVTVYGVDAVVLEGEGLAVPLLGMSFLNRMDMKREGNVMTLTKRY
jgi:aspartyl protease family protein